MSGQAMTEEPEGLLYGFDYARDTRLVYALALEPRSGYVLAGSARWAWQHSIPPTKALRYSVTFRSLRRR